jgi:hypothetical protein
LGDGLVARRHRRHLPVATEGHAEAVGAADGRPLASATTRRNAASTTRRLAGMAAIRVRSDVRSAVSLSTIREGCLRCGWPRGSLSPPSPSFAATRPDQVLDLCLERIAELRKAGEDSQELPFHPSPLEAGPVARHHRAGAVRHRGRRRVRRHSERRAGTMAAWGNSIS